MADLNKTAGAGERLVLIRKGDESSLVLETTAETESAAGDSGRGSPEPSQPPLVFICAQCKRVLGDSTGWVDKDLDDQVVMLKDVSKYVIKDKEPTLSTAPQDNCCMIENLSCSGCKTLIGKVYRSTPKHLDYKRELFCLDIDAVESRERNAALQMEPEGWSRTSYAIGSSTAQETDEKDEPVTFQLRLEAEAEWSKAKAVLEWLQNEMATLKSKKF